MPRATRRSLLTFSLTRRFSFNLRDDDYPDLFPIHTIELSGREYGRREIFSESDTDVEGLADSEGDDERSGSLRLRF